MANRRVMRSVGLAGLMVLVLGGFPLYAQQRVSVQKAPVSAVRKQEARVQAGEQQGQSGREVRVQSRQAVHREGKVEAGHSGSAAYRRSAAAGSMSGKASVRKVQRSAAPSSQRVDQQGGRSGRRQRAVPANAYRRMQPAEP